MYWMNIDTGKVTARDFDDPPFGNLWIEITEEEYGDLVHPLGTGQQYSIYTQEFDDFSDADPGLLPQAWPAVAIICVI